MRMLCVNAYSRDLRLRTLAGIDRGIPRKEVSKLFGVSRSTIERRLKRRRRTGDVNAHEIPGRPSGEGKALGELDGRTANGVRQHPEAEQEGAGAWCPGPFRRCYVVAFYG